MSTSQDPGFQAADVTALFEALEKKFPSGTLGADKWYLVPVGALSGSPQPTLVGSLYTYLISQPQYATPASRHALIRRIREALVKNVPIVGVCKPLQAIMEIDARERPEDKDYSFSREHWQSGPEMRRRGQKWLDIVYRGNSTDIFQKCEAHKDFAFISTDITYGLYLSDHSILDGVDTELVVLAGVMIQNLRPMTSWHLRAMRRIGIAQEDVELVQQCIEMCAKFTGAAVDQVPRVGDVEHEV